MSGAFALRGHVRVGCGGGARLCVVVVVSWLCVGFVNVCCGRRWRTVCFGGRAGGGGGDEDRVVRGDGSDGCD